MSCSRYFWIISTVALSLTLGKAPGDIVPVGSSNVFGLTAKGAATNSMIVLHGIEINEIKTVFNIRKWNSKDNLLEGFVEFKNNTDKERKFGVSSFFPFHVVIHDEKGKEIAMDYARLGRILPYRIDYDLPAGGSAKHPFRVELTKYWSLTRGDYRVSFVYDIRLVRAAKEGESLYLPWSKGNYQIKFMPE